MVKRKTKRNYIAAIIKEDGTLTTSQNQVATEFTCFYEALLGVACQVQPIDSAIMRAGARVRLEHSLALIILRQEMKEALFGIDDDKSSG